jgi:hypothetical protein
MKNRILLVAIFAIPAGLFLYFWFFPVSEKKSSAPENKISQDAAVAGALAKQNSNVVAIINSNFARVQTPPENLHSAAVGKISVAPAGPPAPLQFTNFAPTTVLQNVSRAVRQYGEMFGGNPVGNNVEITAALSGNNPKHVNFLTAEAGMRVNGNGELVDAWNTPYFFHQLSGSDMEIHSAGPDKIMWTADDLVTR